MNGREEHRTYEGRENVSSGDGTVIATPRTSGVHAEYRQSHTEIAAVGELPSRYEEIAHDLSHAGRASRFPRFERTTRARAFPHTRTYNTHIDITGLRTTQGKTGRATSSASAISHPAGTEPATTVYATFIDAPQLTRPHGPSLSFTPSGLGNPEF